MHRKYSPFLYNDYSRISWDRGVAVKGKEIGFGIIGCGMISDWHANAILATEGTKLVGFTDLSEASRTAAAKKYDSAVFDSAEIMLENREIDAVCICTPSGLHAPLAIKAANAGKHIVVEKPMALTLEEADAIIEACRTNKVKMEVISQLRFTDAVRRLKGTVERGELGKLISGDIYMKYYRSQEYYDKGGWRGTWKMDGGGALMNQGIHGIDLLQYVMGPVKSVFAYTRTLARKIEVEDTAAAVVEFQCGALGVIQGTTSVYPGSPRRLEVNGDKGTIVLEEDSIATWTIQGQEQPGVIQVKQTSGKTFSNPAAFGIEGHIRQIGDMADAIREDRKTMVDQYEGRKPVEIITAIYESSRTGKRIELPGK